MQKQEKIVNLFISLPVLIALLVLCVIPLGGSIYLSLHDRDLRIKREVNFVGLRNYLELMRDHRFWNSLRVSFSYLGLVTSSSIIIGLLLTYLCNEFKGKMKGFILIVFFLPFMIPRVSAALTWRFMFFPILGIFSYFARLLNIQPIAFFASPLPAFFAISIVDIWQWAPFITVLLVSSIDSIPREVIDAAALDCNKFQSFIYVILPLLKPTIFFLILIKILESMRAFDLIYNITKGGPGTATETLDMYAFYRGVLWSGEISYASAMSVIMLVITIVLMNFLWKKTKKFMEGD